VSDKVSERLLALQILRYVGLNNEFPPELADTVTAITFRDNPDVAGAALLVMGVSDEIPNEVVLLELLAPLKVQFDRTREAFKKWTVRDEVTEQVIKHSNEYIRDLLISRAYLIPKDLQEDAGELVKHYNAWLAEYQRVYAASCSRVVSCQQEVRLSIHSRAGLHLATLSRAACYAAAVAALIPPSAFWPLPVSF
jgi:hypothetical protein